MGDLWLNPGFGDKSYIKGITDRLQNIYRQRYDEYINSPDNDKKCGIFNICNNNTEVYAKKSILQKLNLQTSKYIHQIMN